MNSFHLKSVNLDCPTCKTHLDGASSGESFNQPQQGDLSICIYCGSMLEFDGEGESLGFRELTKEDLEKLSVEHPLSYDQLMIFKTRIDELIAARTKQAV